MLVILLLAVSAASVGLFTFLGSSRAALENEKKTAEVLAQARAALIGYAVKGGCSTDIANTPSAACPVPRWNWRPGSFPCPDANNDGIEEFACVAGAVGRIPWKTLGMPEPRDSAGETLWYSVADRFRSASPLPINSDTPGSITVYAPDGVSPLTTTAAAVIFAPGVASDAQNRTAGATVLCSATATVIARNLCADNYLDRSANRNNATTNGPFVAGQLRDAAYPNYNDQVSFITTRDFMPAVEMRVGSELEALLDDYADLAACQCYPWADNFVGADGVSDDKVTRGRLPLVAAPENWGTGAIPALPAWVGANNWNNVTYYTVSILYVKGGKGKKCKDSNDCVNGSLTVDGSPGVEALFFMPGVPLQGIARPSAALSAYLEDTENNDGTDDFYVEPTASELNRDRIFYLSGASSALCLKNAKKLIKKAPCADSNGNISKQCQRRVDRMSICASSCLDPANVLITPPCAYDLTSDTCRAAIAQLRQC